MRFDSYWGVEEDQKMHNRWYLLKLLQGTDSFARGLTAQRRVPAPEPLKFSIVPVDEVHDSRVAKFYIWCLRTFVDAWIESGRDGDYEDPRKRHLTMPLQDALNHWAGERHPELTFRKSGEPDLYMPASFVTNYDAPFRAAWDNALAYFAQFLDSPYCFLIAKCRSEGCTYYYPQRMPRGPLKYGTYCPTHRQRASAARSVIRKRNTVQETRLTIAKSLWGRWPHWARTEEQRRRWVLKKLNDKQPSEWRPIKINWVTRNLKDIAEDRQENVGKERSHNGTV